MRANSPTYSAHIVLWAAPHGEGAQTGRRKACDLRERRVSTRGTMQRT
jgi:hypothetical protein